MNFPFSPNRQYNLHVQDLDLLSPAILIPLFQPFRTGSDKQGQDHVAGESTDGYSLAAAQITLSSVKLSLSLREAD
jgi:hypothetical protein